MNRGSVSIYKRYLMSLHQTIGHFTTEIRCQSENRLSSPQTESRVSSPQTESRVSGHLRLKEGCQSSQTESRMSSGLKKRPGCLAISG